MACFYTSPHIQWPGEQFGTGHPVKPRTTFGQGCVANATLSAGARCKRNCRVKLALLAEYRTAAPVQRLPYLVCLDSPRHIGPNGARFNRTPTLRNIELAACSIPAELRTRRSLRPAAPANALRE